MTAALALVVGFTACRSGGVDRALDAIDESVIAAHLGFLSSDLLEGRAAGSRGARLAADYIANQFALAGLEPLDGDGFFQTVPLLAAHHSGTIGFRARGGAALEPVIGEDILVWSNSDADSLTVTAELVFIGSHVARAASPEPREPSRLLRGNVALLTLPLRVAAGDGDAAEHWPSRPGWHGLVERVAAAGAVGAMIIHTPESTGMPWRVLRESLSGERLRLAEDRGETEQPALVAWVRREMAVQLVSMAGLDFETLLEMARSPVFEPIATGVTVTSRQEVRTREVRGLNVGGWLRGGDPRRRDEVVVLAANYDGLGMSARAGNDSIYNGAYDNAGGTALLLNLTQAFGRLDRRPPRSLLFLALTCGEEGGLGVEYFLREPAVPPQRTSAVLVLEGANLWGRTQDVALTVERGSGLRGMVRTVAAAEDMRLATDEGASHRLLLVTDVDRFGAAGIPAVALSNGWDFLGRMPGWGARIREGYYEERYHGPGDVYLPSDDLGGAVQQGRVALRLAYRLSAADPASLR